MNSYTMIRPCLLSFLACILFSASLRAGDVDVRWSDATMEAVPIILRSMNSGEDVAGLALLGVGAALSGQDFYAIKFRIENNSARRVVIAASEFSLRDESGHTSSLLTFADDDSGSPRYWSSLKLNPGESLELYGFFAAGPQLGRAIRSGRGTLYFPR